MNCVSARLTGCANALDLNFVYGYLSPSGTVQGVIVYFDGGEGTDPSAEGSEVAMLQYYLGQGYEVVQVAWHTAWEATWNDTGTPAPAANIQNAACRPATFLNYVATAPASWNLYQAVSQANSAAGMCAQGFSAGSAQIAYSMAYYGAGSYLDNVELISGPVFSDIEQGCQEPQANQVTVCPTGQLGCPQGQASWQLYPTYVPGQNTDVATWTNDSTCANPHHNSSTSSETAWLNQSIVDKSTGGSLQGAIPTFNYLSTAMSAWLCRTVQNPNNINCTTNYQYQYCPNNTSPQGQLFYANLTQSNSPPVFNEFPVDLCNGPEGAPQGNVGSPTGPLGETKIEQDMAGTLGPPPTPGMCVHRPH